MRNLFAILIIVCFGYSDAFSQEIQFENESDSLWFVDYEYIPGEDNFEFIKDQISCIQGEIPLNYNERVHAFVNYFAIKNRSFTEKIIERQAFYFPIFEKYLAQYGLPDDLKYLSIIESALVPTAKSHAKAVGLWQFMPYTGRSFGLHEDSYIDERMDIEYATEAACKYLKQLYGMFNDWELAIAAYNTGPGNVRKAMKRSGKSTFWEIYPFLHRETRAYLPQFVAITYVMEYSDLYNFSSKDYELMVEYDTILVKNYVHLPSLAEQLNLCEEELTSINTSLRFGAIPDSKKPYALRVPIQAIDQLKENRQQLLDSAGKVDKQKIIALAGNQTGSTYGKNKVVYRVQSGDVLGKIASRYNVRVTDIKKWNNLSSDMIRVGQKLDIWLNPAAYSAQNNTATTPTKPTPAPPVITNDGSGKFYTVQPGDTLWDISKKFNGLSIEQIKQMNGLKNDSIKPGQKLKIG